MTHSIWFRLDRKLTCEKPHPFKKNIKALAIGLAVVGCIGSISPKLLASNSVVTGSVRVQMLSSSLVRLESAGAEGFEDRTTFHVVNRNWPGTSYSSNLVSGMVVITTPGYVVYVPQGATSLTGAYVTSPAGQVLYQFNGTLNNSVWLPGPSDNPTVLSFADTPRLIPPPGGVVPAPAGSPLIATSGWDTNNDAPDIYVFVPNGSYAQMRSDFLKLTGPTEMVPLYAFGLWDSRWFDYSEATALAQVDDYRSRQIPLDVLVCDTGWRQGASTGYQPNTSLFPNLPRFFSEAHAKNVRVMFNDHPEPIASSALNPAEVTYRYTNLTQLLGQGLDVWWYDRNWGVSLKSPSPNLRHEVWGMAVYHDATKATNASLRPLIMANVDGIDNGIRNRPPDAATHRYSIQWTGDIRPDLTYLTYAVENAVHSGVQSLFPYVSDDLGGHVADPSPGDYIRWIEYGALSPIYRPHCTHFLSRMPWTFGPESEWTARRFINLRYRLLPEFYAAARKNYDCGEPIIRRLDLDYPQYPEAKQESQYLIGHSILVAPVTQGVTLVPSAWLTTTNGQAGLNASYFSNTNLAGASVLTRVDPNIDFNWGTGSPGGSVGSDHFSVRWTGNITVPPSAGDVTLAATSDDGVRVWVDNQLCIGNWGPNDSATTESTLLVKAGQTHQLRVEYLELTGNAIMRLKWRGASALQSVWIPPGNWINAWTGALLKGPTTIIGSTPLEQIPLYIRSGSIFALAPQMQYTGQLPWDPVTLDVYPSTTETDQTSLYEDDTVTTAYKQGQFRKTTLKTWADDGNKTVSVAIGAAVGSYSNASAQRSWVARLRRPPNWSSDLAPISVTLNGNEIGPVVRRVGNTSAMPLGADNGAPDADVFEMTLPETSVLTSNLLVASFASATSPWSCSDIGAVGANGNVVEGASTFSNAVCVVRGGGAGIGGTNDGFHFLYQPCVGNVQMTVQLLNQQSANPLAEAGIMISETLNPSARNAVLALTPGQQLVFQIRSIAGYPGQVIASTSLSAPCWLRLVRNGNAFISYTSTNNTTWTLVNSWTIPGFSAQAYVGLAVTAAITNTGGLATNSFGNPIIGASAEMSGGVYSVDNTNCNVAIFSNLTLNSSASISTVPNQTTAQSTPTQAIPFTVGSTSGNPLTLSANSSDTNLLSVSNIAVTGTGGTRWVTLTPNRGVSGTCIVTLTVSDGIGSASTQFTLTVWPFTGDAYPSLPVTLAGPIDVSYSLDGAAGITIFGATNGWIANNYQSSSTNTLYTYFSMEFFNLNGETADDQGGCYGGLHFYEGSTERLLTGESWLRNTWSIDDKAGGEGGELSLPPTNVVVVNQYHTMAVKSVYSATGNATETVWLDPDFTKSEGNQPNPPLVVSMNNTFDNIRLRCGNGSAAAEFSNIVITATSPFAVAVLGVLSIRQSGGSMNLSWTSAGTLQRAPAVTGPWTDTGNNANPQVVSATNSATFFRLRP
jgi:hypothetical protein